MSKELQAEIEEQARLLGMSGSREAKLLTKIDRLTLVIQVAIGTLLVLGHKHKAAELKEMLKEVGK